jgi:hypothetical protein
MYSWVTTEFLNTEFGRYEILLSWNSVDTEFRRHGIPLTQSV